MATDQLLFLNTVAPTSGDDTGDGYKEGDIWLDVNNDRIYICINSSGGAAIWIEVVGRTLAQTLTNKTLTTPTIASFTNATHNHQNAAGGGTLSFPALSSASPRVYTSNDTWTKPSNLLYVIVEVVGGGGGGGGAAATGASTVAAGRSGGGGGTSKKKILAASLGATETVTVGAAGAAGAAGANGGAGGNSSFGSHCTANGGVLGNAGGASSTLLGVEGVAGGSASGGDINISGGSSNPGVYLGVNAISGNGGGSVYGAGAPGRRSNADSVAGAAGGAYGGGGSGGVNGNSQSAVAGGAGAAGVVIVWEYLNG